jgi:hypothetical protein
MAAPLPPFFRSLRLLRGLNVAGVGLSLSAVTGAAFGHFLPGLNFSAPTALSTALPTLLIGAGWALLMRWRELIGRTQLRRGWVLSIPLAIMNCALASSILSGYREGVFGVLMAFFPCLLVSATFGVFFWLPALLLTLTVFGLPIAWSQRQSRKGLAGEERGEIAVGAAVGLLSLLALVLATYRAPSTWGESTFWQDTPEEAVPLLNQAFRAPDSAATWTLVLLALLGLAAGLAATTLAARRERRRRRFVALAEAGEAPGFRVDATTEGKVLVRVASPEPGAYRAASPEAEDEELFALDERGLATHPRQVAGPIP